MNSEVLVQNISMDNYHMAKNPVEHEVTAVSLIQTNECVIPQLILSPVTMLMFCKIVRKCDHKIFLPMCSTSFVKVTHQLF